MLQCDVLAQDCDEGMKCTPYDMDGDNAWDSTQCVMVMGDGVHGEPCTAEGGASGIDDCAEGYMCWNVNEDGEGLCVGHCTGSPDMPSCDHIPGSKCIGGRSALWLCIPGCDPILQDCWAGDTCIGDPTGDGFVCVLDASGGQAPEGATCEFVNVCNPGLFCATPSFYPGPDCQDSYGCCAPFCDLDDAQACEGLSVVDAECVPWFEQGQAPPGHDHVGGCGIMP